MKGKFIVIDGLDGAGKSTQARLLDKYLREKGYKTFLTSEISHGVIGGILRAYLDGRLNLPKEALPLLFAADRIDHTETKIKPALERGMIVICDRYFPSNLAYQSLLFDMEWLKSIERFALNPDLIIILDVSVEEALRRLQKERIFFSLYEKKEKFQKVRDAFIKIAKEYPNAVLVNGEGEIDEVFVRVKKVVKEKLGIPFLGK